MAGSFGSAHGSLNVMKKPLGLFSKDPMAGFYRNGYCDVGPKDTGNHSVAATLSNDFLHFTASRGNNLRSISLTAGCKWCLCAARWKEAMDYAKTKSEEDKGELVSKVHLHVSYEDLKKFAAESEANNASNVAQSRKGGMSGAIKERTELAGNGEMTSQEL